MSDPKRFRDDATAPRGVVAFLAEIEPAARPAVAKRTELARHLGALVAKPAAPSAGLVAAKWAAIVGTVLGGAALVAVLSERPAPPPAPPSNRVVSAAPSAPARMAVPAPPVVTEAPEQAPRIAPRGVQRAEPAPRDTLDQEERLLEAARHAVNSAPGRSLAALEQHRKRFPNGQLTAERMYLRVEALRRLGRETAAREAATALSKRYPGSTYARRVSGLVKPE